jgi:hypothetical protein
MCPTRRASAVVTAAVIAMLLTACTSGPGRPGHGATGPAAASGRAPARPDGGSTSSAAPAAESALPCDSFIGTSARAAPLPVVLGVVALAASPGSPALQTALSGDGNGPLRLFAKTALLVRPSTTFELIVPGRLTSRLSIGWGAPGPPSHRVLVSNCAGPGGGWLAYAGGFWIDHPACVPIIVRADGRQQQVNIGVGTACPGQRPPQGPSQG